ncbi:MAG: CPBP family intramembrane metalloprotease [Flavobacteriales bacterium]|nr:CPBP family intramembrane metalloprotease [Flavobacteriales bacterium]
MHVLQKLIRNYKSSLNHFYSIVKSELFILVYLITAIISQLLFGFHLYGTISLAISYSVGVFIFSSIAFSIVFNSFKNTSSKIIFRNNNIQLLIIGLIVILYFLVLSGQFPQTSLLNKLSEPVRHFFYEPIMILGFSSTVNSILVNNAIAVIIPLLLLLVFTKQTKEFYVDKLNVRILILLTLLYLPIIIFGQKPVDEIVAELPIYLFIAVIPEEFLFRGFLQSRLESAFKNPLNAILLTSIIFGLIHLPINIRMYGETVGIATCIGNNAFGGLFIGYLFYKTRSIWTVIIFHLISGIALI